MKKQAFNPYLPSWEYIPDGEPYVFGDRVYVYGSHDYYNGHVFCMGDYMGWSAPIDDLSDWRCEGVIYPRTADPLNANGHMCLYAPDVTQGPDGRYYLYYVLDKVSVVSVAVCDTPAGRYQFLGYVHYKDGTRLGNRPGDEPQFDPGVLTEGDTTYLYTGFCGQWDKSRHGAMVTVLENDMVTIKEEPRIVVPGCQYSAGSGFEGHAYFEAASIRKRGDTYYFVYSSEKMHELCYATSKSPVEGFQYGGVIVSNNDLGISSYKPADMPIAAGGNNHGSIVQIKDQWYIFYHRQTNNSWYSRQGCAEPIYFDAKGYIAQVEITSCGLNGCVLEGEGEYPSYIACHLHAPGFLPMVGYHMQPHIKQEGRDDDKNEGYVGHIINGTVIGFKYFNCKDVKGFGLTVRGYANGIWEVRTEMNGEVLAELKTENSNVWVEHVAQCAIPDGKQAIYLTYKGGGDNGALKSIRFIK